jgi:cytochrome c-type biogenesis protein CcmF
MVIHPPMLYMGYVGFSVAFPFAIAALLGGKLDATWARWSRPWTTAAWSFLTIGIALGSWWAYYELGWGGWWFWDPVENASFMPWLVGTALLHSLASPKSAGRSRAGRCCSPSSLSRCRCSARSSCARRADVGACVRHRSGARRVHPRISCHRRRRIARALCRRGPARGRRRELSQPISRESLLLANNILLVVACASVLLGTLYPLFLDALGSAKASVGPPYFNFVFPILMAPAAFLMGIGPIASWRRRELPDLWTRLALGAGDCGS